MAITDHATLGAYAEGFTDGAAHIVELLKAKLELERPTGPGVVFVGWVSRDPVDGEWVYLPADEGPPPSGMGWVEVLREAP